MDETWLSRLDEASELAALFAHEGRIRILALLLESEWDVNSLAKEVGLSHSALSQHLKRLRDADVVETRQEAQTIYYFCRSKAVAQMFKTLRALFSKPRKEAQISIPNEQIHAISLALSHGIFVPHELKIVQTVFNRVTSEPWFKNGSRQRNDFARYVFRMYMRGLVLPDRLEALCRTAAKRHFATRTVHSDRVEGHRVLVVEDDYFLATEAADRLTTLGAKVIGPVGNVTEALDLVEHSNEKIDAALLDINLGGQMVYPVAALLKMNHIPFAFVTGYDERNVPLFYRSSLTFTKPGDWGVMLQQVIQSAARTV